MKKPYYQCVKSADRKYYYRRHGFFFISKNPGCFTSGKIIQAFKIKQLHEYVGKIITAREV